MIIQKRIIYCSRKIKKRRENDLVEAHKFDAERQLREREVSRGSLEPAFGAFHIGARADVSGDIYECVLCVYNFGAGGLSYG
jgi:hypothetical protein